MTIHKLGKPTPTQKKRSRAKKKLTSNLSTLKKRLRAKKRK